MATCGIIGGGRITNKFLFEAAVKQLVSLNVREFVLTTEGYCCDALDLLEPLRAEQSIKLSCLNSSTQYENNKAFDAYINPKEDIEALSWNSGRWMVERCDYVLVVDGIENAKAVCLCVGVGRPYYVV